MVKTQKRATGSFYTCLSIADYIAGRTIVNKDTKVLEPSFGDGSFINSALKRFVELNTQSPTIYGVEIRKEPFDNISSLNPTVKCSLMDFMDYKLNTKVDAVIGNPPYISLRNLSVKDRNKAKSLMKKYHIELPTSGSLWMPFVIHATELLNTNGRLAYVLPYEMTYVRYAFPLWEYLKKNYSKLSIYRIYKDFFPEVDVETVVFIAEGKGGKTEKVEYKTFYDIEDLFSDNSITSTSISIEEISSLNKPFEWELIAPQTKKIITSLRKKQKLGVLIDDCKFKIGYVCGNKTFFHPSEATIKQYKLKKENLIPSLVNSKEINNQKELGLDTNSASSSNNLFYPTKLCKGERAYIAFGETEKINQGYKCKVRNPWYITPSIEIPDVILTVFGDIPRLISNTKGYAVSNSLLCGTITSSNQITSKEIACRWYNSLTLLLIELYIHSLGGGTLVLIPGEMDKMELIKEYPKNKVDVVFDELNKCMLTKSLSDTYALGDELVLKQIYKLKDADIQAIRESLSELRSWRRPDQRR